MMAAVTKTGSCNARALPESPSNAFDSEKSNVPATESSSAGRRPRRKEITPRYPASSILSSSKSNSSCIPTVSSASYSSSIFASSTPRRSESVDSESPAKNTVLRSITRSLSVSFQGESFFLQTKEAKPTPQKHTLECRKANAGGAENSQPDRFPTTSVKEAKSATRSLDYFTDKEHSLLMTVRLLPRSLVFDEAVTFSTGGRTQSLDSEIFTSGNTSSFPEPGFPATVKTKPRGIRFPARFRQENGCHRTHSETPTKISTGKQQPLSSSMVEFPRFVPSPPSGPVSSPSPREKVSRIRRNIMESYSYSSACNAPSIISFASEVRRKKKGESRIEDAHLLRLFHNRYMQWRYINARSENTISTQMMNATNNLNYARMAISEFRDSAMNGKIKLQALSQNLKLAFILKEQIAFLEKWSTLSEDHEASLNGAIEALKASTLRLPIIGAKVDIQEVKEATNSATIVMQSIMASTCSLHSKMEGLNSLIAELGKASAYELSLLNQSRYLLSIVAALHVKQTSLQSYKIQLQINK